MNSSATITRLVLAVGLCLIPVAEARLSPQQVAALPTPVNRPVRFATEIKPILETACVKCHGRGKDKGGFRLDTREWLLHDADSGPAVIPGNSAGSYLIELVAGFDPDSVMPKKGSKLKPAQIALLRAWIDQGAAWDSSITFARPAPANLQPRQIDLPASIANTHPVDRILDSYFRANRVRPGPQAGDAVFARRVYLDLLGVLPTPAELESFTRDHSPDRRARLVSIALDDNPRYAEHWLTFWNDLLRNDYRGTGYIDSGRKQITEWLYSALATNLSFDRFVSQLINPVADSEGFTKGIVWRGVVNASQVPQMQAAQNISQVFMGVNLKCASCHDSFINDWTLADAYGLAGIYADDKLEMAQCDKPTGKFAPLKFIYAELGSIDPKAPKLVRLQQLASVITGAKNGRLSRTLVNRLWARFMGRGLVEPVDDMEAPAWNRDLLDWLAEDFVASGYDVKHLIERITSSRAYQMASVPEPERADKSYVFRGPLVRRMSAEQFRDAVGSLTGVGYAKPDAQADWVAGLKPAERARFELNSPPQWIWAPDPNSTQSKTQAVYFRKTIILQRAPEEAYVAVAADSSFTLFVNGKNVGTGKDARSPNLFDLRPHLREGTNLFAISVVKIPVEKPAAASEKSTPAPETPAGLIVATRIRIEVKPIDLVSDATWQSSQQKQDGWEKAEFTETNWTAATELGGTTLEPWKLGDRLISRLAGPEKNGHVRASLVAADPLQVALGRPNREQVITSRAAAATTLQALELTNGGTLNSLLQDGAKRLVGKVPPAGSDLIGDLYLKAYGRRPTAAELKMAAELTGQPVHADGVADLLWTMTMLPEFQLIF